MRDGGSPNSLPDKPATVQAPDLARARSDGGLLRRISKKWDSLRR
jgi:hypothetical protein